MGIFSENIAEFQMDSIKKLAQNIFYVLCQPFTQILLEMRKRSEWIE